MLKTRFPVATSILTLALALAAAALASGCGTEPVPDTPSFEADLLPIFESRCIRCHGAGGKLNADPTYGGKVPGFTILTQAADIGCAAGATSPPDCYRGARYATMSLGLLIFADPKTGTMPPSPAPKLTDRQFEVIKRWSTSGLAD